jgi:hypothetical protein
MEPDLNSGYLKKCWERKRTLVACRVEKGKMVKIFEDHNFLLKTHNWENE